MTLVAEITRREYVLFTVNGMSLLFTDIADTIDPIYQPLNIARYILR